MITIDLVVGLSGIFIGVVSLILSLYFARVQKKDMDGASARLEAVLGKLNVVSNSLEQTGKNLSEADATLRGMLEQALQQSSTRYVGRFPDNMSELNLLLQRAHGSVKIMVDFVGYCLYSDSDAFETYKGHLRRIAKTGSVEMVIYDERGWRDVIALQFPESGFPTERAGSRWANYWSGHRLPDGSQNPTYQQFVDYLRDEDENAVRELTQVRADIHESRTQFPFFCWITNREEAIISFPSAKGPEEQVSFLTRDLNLLKVFADMFEKAKQQCVGGDNPSPRP